MGGKGKAKDRCGIRGKISDRVELGKNVGKRQWKEQSWARTSGVGRQKAKGPGKGLHVVSYKDIGRGKGRGR